MISPEVAHRLNVFLTRLSVRASTGKKFCRNGNSGLAVSFRSRQHRIGGDHQRIYQKAFLIAKICVFSIENVLNSTADLKAVRGVYWSDLCNI